MAILATAVGTSSITVDTADDAAVFEGDAAPPRKEDTLSASLTNVLAIVVVVVVLAAVNLE